MLRFPRVFVLPLLLVVLAAATLAGLGSALAPSESLARGGEGAPLARPDDAAVFFDQAVRWVNRGQEGIHNLTDFYADLLDVKFNVGSNNQEGHMRLWLKTPDMYRFEMRQTRNFSGPNVRVLSTKILSGDEMWVVHPTGQAQRMHGTPAGQGAVTQMKDDRRRLLDLARFLTLDGLKGPGVTFTNEGFKTGSGSFEGNWIKIRRQIQGGADVTFHLAYSRTEQGVLASYPGVVTIVGDPRQNEPTEYYVLKKWVQGPQFNFPSQIEAFSQATPNSELQRFLLAFPRDVRINTGLQSSLFAPPQ